MIKKTLFMVIALLLLHGLLHAEGYKTTTTFNPFTGNQDIILDGSQFLAPGATASLVVSGISVTVPSYMFASTLHSTLNANWGNGTLTPLDSSAGPSIVNGKLGLIYGDVRYLDYSAVDNANSAQTGCLKFKYTPNYTNIPPDTFDIFAIIKENNNVNSAIILQHIHGGVDSNNLLLTFFDSGGNLVGQFYAGSWAPTKGTTYEFEYDYDNTNGIQRLFINGNLFTTTNIVYSRNVDDIRILRIGGDIYGVGKSNGSFEDVVFYPTVQHTENYTPGYSIPEVETKINQSSSTFSDIYCLGKMGIGTTSPTAQFDCSAPVAYFRNAVGIGTNNPNALLDVVDGAIQTNDTIYVPQIYGYGYTDGLSLFGSSAASGISISTSGYIGIGLNTAETSHLLQLYGGAYCDGTGDWIAGSDISYKRDIKASPYGLNDVLNLRPVTYIHKQDKKNKIQIGLIAQEVKPIIPEVVEGEEGAYGIAYGRLTPVLIQAIKDLNTRIDFLENKIILLENKK